MQTTRATADPVFPPELFDIILDLLHNDLHTLSSCNLVCRWWHEKTRSTLFRRVRFTMENVQQYRDLFCPQRTEFNLLIREVQIIDLQPGVCASIAPFLMLKNSVETLSVEDMEDFSEADCTALVVSFRRASSVRVLSCTFAHPLDLCRFITGFPTLRTLEMVGGMYGDLDAEWEARLAQAEYSLAPTIDVMDLEAPLDAELGYYLFLKWLVEHSTVLQPRRVGARGMHDAFADTYSQLLHRVADSLVELTLELKCDLDGDYTDGALTEFPEYMDLSPLHQLQILHIVHYIGLNANDWVYDALSQLPRSVEVINITFDTSSSGVWVEEDEDMDWQRLYHTIEGRNLHSLTQLRIYLKFDWDAAPRNLNVLLISSQLAEYHKRGILSFVWL